MESTIWYRVDDRSKIVFGPERLVVAFCTHDLEQNPKYGASFLGPIRFDPENGELLDYWCEWMLDLYGGYVHLLFIEPGLEGVEEIKKAEASLAEFVAEHKEQDRLDSQEVALDELGFDEVEKEHARELLS